MFLGYLFRACKRFGRSDAHTHTYSNLRDWVWVVPQSMKPTLELTWIFPGVEASGCGVCGKTAEAEGCGRGASLLMGSRNFHSRVLLKLVLRPLPRLNTFLPSCPVRPSTPQLPPRSAAAARRLVVPFQTISLTPVLCSGRGWQSVGLFVWMCEL